MNIFNNFSEAVVSLQTDIPIIYTHYEKSSDNIQQFLNNFKGDTFYAVKSNPKEEFIKFVMSQGITHFDVASLNEVKLVHNISAEMGIRDRIFMAFMNPIKSRTAIRSAYFDYGVKDFSYDTEYELLKIVEETKNSTNLGLHCRIVVPKGLASYDITGKKFGAEYETAIQLLKLSTKYSTRVGVCFHAGSQLMSPSAYTNAITYVHKLVMEAHVKLSVFDVGGGFPVSYGEEVNLGDYFSAINEGIKLFNFDNDINIWCEPGRAICAPCQSLIVKVMLRKNNMLHINDGIYGNLFEACHMCNQTYPVQLIRVNGKVSENIVPFEFYGPTCDSVDHITGPFYLPEDTNEGDYIVLKMAGAYTTCSSSNFNGFSDLIYCNI